MGRNRGDRRIRERGLDADGVPLDARDWTEADWADFWHGMVAIKARIAKRHTERGDDERRTKGGGCV